MDERYPYQRLVYYSCGEKQRNPVALAVKSEEMRKWLIGIPKTEVVCLDVETTGLYPRENDEILQISMCDGNGEMLLDSYVHPAHRKRWPNAEAIHGISPAMVKDAPTLLDLADEIRRILDGCTLLIGYNVRSFDLEFLRMGGIELPRRMNVYDLINDCSVLYSTWNRNYGNYTYISLENMANRFHITYDAHSSAEDVVATTKLFYRLLNSAKMKNAVKSASSMPAPAPRAPKATAGSAGHTTTPATTQNRPVGCATIILTSILAIICVFLAISLLRTLAAMH